ncbi:hypothetical protein L9F63_019087 [Diploptera punctata]|uniref:Methylosome protein 50 n=1 Tax=Diploptera punctata TaxID=6984 RepID=A0AAD7ZVW8_DIPPU|nr:hypothetical protein L9F63_019087 [Diploptera punctata]
MEPAGLEVEPNRNADAYRNYQPIAVPAQIERYIDFIELCEDGYMLLGCSNLTGRFWTGSLWYFIDPDAAPDVEKCLTGIECETGVTDGKFLEDKQKIFTDIKDSGTVQILGLSESSDEHTFHFESLNSVCEHDDSVLSVSVFPDKTQAVTGSSDTNIKVWSIESLISEHTYRPAHLLQVTSVCANPHDRNNVFASCSLDGMALMWDIRTPKPAKVAWCDRAHELSALSWHTSKDVLAVGSNTGEVTLIDTRQLKTPLAQTVCFSRPVHRLSFATHKPDWLAVCADDTKVKVLDCASDTPNILYCDDRHDDFVRGLTWHNRNETLYSCGWDKQVLLHNIALSPANMEVNGIVQVKT